MAALPRLPACRLCYQRKVKCDSQRPRCEACAKSNSECLFTDPATGETISRRELAELENTVHQLSEPSEDGNDGAADDEDRHVASPEHEAEAGTAFPQGSGLSFMSPLFNDQEWRQRNAYVLRSLANASATAEFNIEPNDLPSPEDAQVLFDSFLSSVQMQNPILLRKDVLDLYERIFRPEDSTKEVQVTKHDLFRTFIIVALGSIQPHRTGNHQCHPYGYYLSAMRNFDRFVVRDGLNPIQDLLLLIRFGIYYHIGTSIWAMVRLCIRMCVEQGLHRRQETHSDGGLLQEQMRRRVFWICYMMDRYSSITLNRPFAISDTDIDVGPAADTDDQQLSMAEQSVHSLDELTSQQTILVASEMSAFIAGVRLRQISSRIHRYFADTLNAQTSARTGHDDLFLATGHIHVALQGFLAELESWRASAPVYEAPTCLFERGQWYDLLQAREAFNLLRRAVDVAPKRDGAPSRILLTQCQVSAVRVIELYSEMYGRSIATYTRSYFQLMFTAGLSLLYCGSVLSKKGSSSVEQCSRALEQCRTTLTNMTVDLPDARHYVAVFDALYRHISQNLNQVLQRNGSSHQESSSRVPLSNETPASSTNIPYTDPMTSGTDGGTNNGGFHTSYNEAHYPQDAVEPFFPMSIPSIIGDGQNYLTAEGQSGINSEFWNWDMLNDEALWNVGQYVVGDPASDFGIYDPT